MQVQTRGGEVGLHHARLQTALAAKLADFTQIKLHTAQRPARQRPRQLPPNLAQRQALRVQRAGQAVENGQCAAEMVFGIG